MRLPAFNAAFFSRVMVTLILIDGFASAPTAARAEPKCDPLSDADTGWHVVPSLETVKEADGAPYRSGAAGTWFIDHTTTTLPFCNYFDELGSYSMRSYRLDPETQIARVKICRPGDQGGSIAVPPYAGPCPPK